MLSRSGRMLCMRSPQIAPDDLMQASLNSKYPTSAMSGDAALRGTETVIQTTTITGGYLQKETIMIRLQDHVTYIEATSHSDPSAWGCQACDLLSRPSHFSTSHQFEDLRDLLKIQPHKSTHKSGCPTMASRCALPYRAYPSKKCAACLLCCPDTIWGLVRDGMARYVWKAIQK